MSCLDILFEIYVFIYLFKIELSTDILAWQHCDVFSVATHSTVTQFSGEI